MSEINSQPGAGIVILAGAVLIIIGLIIWFLVSRISMRAGEQIRLLEALLEEQKKQNKLLRQLTEQTVARQQHDSDSAAPEDIIRLIPER